MAEFPKSIKYLIEAFERLPGIGPKGATRLVFYLLNTPKAYVQDWATTLINLKDEMKICRECFSVTEQDVCSICRDKQRNSWQICVVERAIDVMAIENMGGYKGVYHVLGGVSNPLEHVGPEELKIDELVERIINTQIEERQFDNAPITFKEINESKEVFKHKLKSIYHARIEYPKLMAKN